MTADSNQRTLAIVSNLIRVLTHKIRTPLSVISNELEAFKAALPGSELDLSRQRVMQISEILKSLSQFAVSPAPKQRTNAQEILEEICKLHAAQIAVGKRAAALETLGDRRLFSLALNSLLGLLVQLDTQVEVESSADAEIGCIVFRSPFRSVLDNSGHAPWTSLSSFFNDGMDLDSFLPPCIDSVLLAQGVSVSVTAQNGISISLRFELCPAISPRS